VSALHKLASAVGRQLSNARTTAAACAQRAGSPQDAPGDSRPDTQQHTPAGAAAGGPRLPSPELAAREARLKGVLLRGTHAARALAARGDGAASAPGTPLSVQQPLVVQPHGGGVQPAAPGVGAPPAQRQLQLGADAGALPGGGLDGTAAFALAPQPPVCASGALPQAWAAPSLAMPHMRPRPGPSRLAHQSSVHHMGAAAAVAAEAMAAEVIAAAEDEDWEGFASDDEDDGGYDGAEARAGLAPAVGPGAGPASGAAAAAAAVAAVTADMRGSFAAGGGCALPLLGFAPPPGLAPLRTQHSGPLAHHQAASAAAAAAAHFDEPVISLRDARREARSRSATPGAGNTPRAGAGAASGGTAAAARGAVVAMEVDASAAGGSQREAGMPRAGAAPAARGEPCEGACEHPAAPYGGHGHHLHQHLHAAPMEDDDDGHDPIAAQLAGAGGAGAAADLGPDDLEGEPFAAELAAVAAGGGGEGGAVAALAGGLALAGTAQLAHLHGAATPGGQHGRVADLHGFGPAAMVLPVVPGMMAFAPGQLPPGAGLPPGPGLP
jgi:hypothetical protein